MKNAPNRALWPLLAVLCLLPVSAPLRAQTPSDDPGPRPPGYVPPPHAWPVPFAPAPSDAPALTSIPGAWLPQGPGPISGGQVEGMVNKFVCGAIHCVIAHPTNPDIVYIGAVNGGVWKTTNATAASPTWTTSMAGATAASIGALAFDPNDATSQTVWAGIGRFGSFYRYGGSRSGLLKTTDGGATWTEITGGGTLVGKNISGMVVRGDTIVVSVNTADSGGNPAAGVWRSTDGGTSFTRLTLGDGSGATGLPEGVSYDVVSSPAAPNTLYTNVALTTTSTAKGIFKSTDLGATWTRVSTPLIESRMTGSVSNIEMSVGEANNVFFGILESGAPVGLFGSTNGGTSWQTMDLPTMPISSALLNTVTNATNATPIVITTAVAHGLSTNNYVEVEGVVGNTAANGIFQITVTSTTSFSLDFSSGNGAYVSGGTASMVTSMNPRGVKGPEEGTPEEIAGGQGSIHFSILAHPTNANIVFTGGDRQDLPFPNYLGAVDYSGNLWRGDLSLAPNGASPSSQWKHLTHSNAVAGIPGGGTADSSSPHADSRDMAMTAGGVLVEVDDGGIFRRTSPLDNTGAWTSMAGNLQVTEAHSITYDTVSNIIITGNQDNGTSVQNAADGTAYTAVSTADGGDVAAAPNPANPAQSIRYSSNQNLGGFRRRTYSNTNTLVSTATPALSPLGGAPSLTGQFTTPVEINGRNANRLLIGAGNGVYESLDQGATVSRISTLSPNDAGFGGRTMIYGGRKDGTDNEEVVYFVDGSLVYRRVTAGAAPAAVAGYTGSTVRGVMIDYEDHDHVFVIDDNQVFRSTDGGVNFTDITGDLPAAVRDFRSLEFVRSGAQWAVVVGTLRGVYAARSVDVMDWAPVGSDMPNVYAWDMDYDAEDDVLVVGTLGRGVWKFTDASSIAEDANAPQEIAVSQVAGPALVSGVSVSQFPKVAAGGSASFTYTIQNLGGLTLSGLALSISGTDAAHFTASALSVTELGTSGSTSFTVTFTRPTLGASNATLEISSNDTDENPFVIALSGEAAPPEIAVEQPANTELASGLSVTDFGLVKVGANAVRNYVIRNAGGPTLSGLGVSVTGGGAAAFQVTQPGTTSLEPGQSTSFSVTFVPTADGAASATLQITSNDDDEAPFEVALSGTGFIPDIAVEQPEGAGLTDGGSTVSYGNVLAGASLTKRFAIRNASVGTLTLGTVSIDGVNASDFVAGTLTRTTLASGQTAYLDVSFRPQIINSKFAALHITSDDPDETEFDVNLSGFGTTPGGPVMLARDININPNGLSPASTTVIGSTAYFTGITTAFGTELWKTDGTTAGTVMVRDLAPGVGGSAPIGLTNFNGTLFFSASNGTNGIELWKTDGSFAGTTLVKDINTGTANSSPGSLTAAGPLLFFSATDATNGTELWKSDGSTAGTVLVANIASGSTNSSPANFRAVGATIYFTATNGTSGVELWKSDGSSGGTVMVKDIISGSGSSSPVNLTVLGTTLYFTVNDGVNGTELWKSDGTSAGTVMVKDINVGSVSSSPASLTAFDGLLYFTATTAAEGAELWVSDGTSAGTLMVKDINAGTASATPSSFLVSGSMLYFSAADGQGRELWKTDGTNAGTVRVKDINPGSSSSTPGALTSISDVLYFQATDGTNGIELWKSDGTEAGTLLVKDIAPGSASSTPTSPANLGGTLIFTASDGLNGVELWKSDGTEAGTVQVLEGQTGSATSSPSNLRHVNGTLYFSASDGGNGTELWKSDGTLAGTVMVSNINSGGLSSSPANFSHVNSTLYFSATDGTNGTELWKSDGTSAGTMMVKNINTGTGTSSTPTQLTAVGSTLFFSATETSTAGAELWKSDGTSAGTVLVKDINPTASTGSSLLNLTNFNGTLYFSANDGTNGAELWRSDGTTAGTVMVMNINAGSLSSSPANLTVLGTTLYFTATTAASGIELWKTDGTTTALVAEIAAGTTSSSPANLTVSGGTLYFSASNGTTAGLNGTELWKIDNSTGLPVLVKDIQPGTTSSSPSSFADVGGTLFFRATTTAEGQELWKSDGTTAGTVLVSNINTGTASSSPFSFVNLGGTLYMSAEQTTTTGREIWKSDGTSAGTVLVADLMPGTAHSNPANLTLAGSLLFFTGIGPDLGTSELFVIDTAPQEEIQVEQPLGTVLLDGSSTVNIGTAGFGGDSVSKTFTIKNTGPQTLTITSVLVDGADAASFSLPALTGATILAGGSLNFTVSLLPTSVGAKTAAIHIENTDSDENPYDIQLTGSVVVAPEIAVQQPAGTLRLDGSSTVVFGDSVFGVAVTKTFTLVNSGSSPLNVTGVTFDGPGSADYSTGGYSGALAVGGSATFDVVFSASAAGARVATLHVLSDDTDEASYDIRLTGIGSAPPGALKLVRDINATAAAPNISGMVLFGGQSYFAANTQQLGIELWKTDGTAAGTVMVKDIAPGPNSSSPANLTVVGSTLYFSATNTTNGIELWKTDGTNAGTVMVKDINVGSSNSSPANLVNFGGTLYFTATDSTTNGTELWKSDGTSAGTLMVKDINPTASTSSSPSLLTVVGGTLFFRATGSSTVEGTELWKSDGTTAGTVLVLDINAGTANSTPSNLIALGTTLLFSATTATNGTELWKSDGTSGGTVLVSDIYSGTTSSSPANLTLVNGTVYFSASTSAAANELWKTDGTAVGTVMVKDINVGAFSSTPSNITPFSSAGFNGFLFNASNGTSANGSELWRSDGTTSGTVMVKDIEPGPNGSFPQSFRVIGGTAYFSASPGTGGLATAFELWRTDGTAENTYRVLDINPGAAVGSTPSLLTDVGGQLVFVANDGSNGAELWASDGTTAGTSLLTELAPGSGNSTTTLLTPLNGTLFFSANDGTTGTELWKVPAAGGVPAQVVDLFPGPTSSNPTAITRFGNSMLFSATGSSAVSSELWRSDGTPAGTVLVKDINPTANTGSGISGITELGGGVFLFSASDGTNGFELWKTDGTTAGTVLVKNINTTANTSSSPLNLTLFNGQIFFSANDGPNGVELWKSDGTDAGTVLVANINSGSLNSSPSNFRVIGSTLYFTATSVAAGTELWKTDGTTAGTEQVLDIFTGSTGSTPTLLTAVGSTLFFAANTTAAGTELWKSDGTAGGTVLVKDILAGTGNSILANFAVFNGQLYFSASDGTNGSELWRSDGTTAGTIMVKDINAGAGNSAPFNLTDVYGTLYFRANTAAQGSELWKSDGTSAGTVFVADIFPGTFSSSLANLTVLDHMLYFTAIGQDLGSELWSYDLGLPEIGIEQPLGANLTDGVSSVAIGSARRNETTSVVTFTLKNTGSATLTGIASSLDGAHAAEFSVSSLPATLAAGATTTFTVTFAPTDIGTRTAALHIASNDPNEAPFDIALNGTGLYKAVEEWRLTNFGSIDNTGSGSDTADPDGDGLTNLQEFAYGLNPGTSSNNALVLTGGTLITRGTQIPRVEVQTFGVNYQAAYCRNMDAASAGYTYTVQFSGDLNTWFNSTATPTVQATDGNVQAVTVPYPFLLPNRQKARFFKVLVTPPP